VPNTNPPSPRPSLPAFMLISAALSLAPGGCSSSPVAVESAGPTFPEDKAQSTTLDIQVVRDETSLKFTNTTAHKFGRSRLWLNRWYSHEIPGLDVGQTLAFNLGEFRDTFGDAFRAGGFWATRNAERLVEA